MRFASFRIAFGLYLIWVLLLLWPWLDTLYSPLGVMPTHLIPMKSYVPFSLLQFDSPLLLRIYVGLAIFGALLFTIGYARKLGALLVFFPMWFLVHRNPLAVTEENAFLLWLLLASLLIPSGEPYSLAKKNPNWFEPRTVRMAAWFLLAVGYTYAGLYKIAQSESFWRNGTALYYVLAETNSRRMWYGEAYSLLPMFVYQVSTFLLMAIQMLSFPLLATRFTRKILWVGMVLFHLGALVFMNIAEISIGMLIVHLFMNPFLPEKSFPSSGKEKNI
jgi:hypothetical protein